MESVTLLGGEVVDVPTTNDELRRLSQVQVYDLLAKAHGQSGGVPDWGRRVHKELARREGR